MPDAQHATAMRRSSPPMPGRPLRSAEVASATPAAPSLDLETPRSSVAPPRPSIVGGALSALLARGVSFSALIASNDDMAIGAIKQLHECGVSVPEQVSVVGFDDIARFTHALEDLLDILRRGERITPAALGLIASLGLAQSALTGLGMQFLWGAWVWWTNAAPNIGNSAAAVFGLLFARQFIGSAATIANSSSCTHASSTCE